MSALNYLIHALISLFFFFVLARFLLQATRADFFNPFSQAAVKITNPFLKPLRMLIPGLYGIDIASIVLILLVHLLHAELLALINLGTIISIPAVLLFSVFGTIMYITWIIFVCAIVTIIVSFVAPYSSHPILLLMRQILQPFVSPFQKLLPPMGGLDFSIMLLLIFNSALQLLIKEMARRYDPGGAISSYIIGF